MRAPSSDEIRPDALVLVDVVHVDLSGALEGLCAVHPPK